MQRNMRWLQHMFSQDLLHDAWCMPVFTAACKRHVRADACCDDRRVCTYCICTAAQPNDTGPGSSGWLLRHGPEHVAGQQEERSLLYVPMHEVCILSSPPNASVCQDLLYTCVSKGMLYRRSSDLLSLQWPQGNKQVHRVAFACSTVICNTGIRCMQQCMGVPSSSESSGEWFMPSVCG